MISLKRKQSGFTIVELLIVIVVIGILVALVVTTFSGVQRKARNAERESDVKAIHTQLEAYFNEHNEYPALANINDATHAVRTTDMKSLDPEALRAPGGSAQTLCAPDDAATNCYAYVTDGATYTLTATLEGGGTFVKQNLN